ncbi:DUF882 domain-containing protein [Ancylobacter amanitiformis]|uniref:Murein endopeptidase K n=1 Tax=Ancylobacter amanitiformis TaxID=217069 RepID=A0ABU0LNH9_9HYPH|nr:DUF882 domain-containing protein [Ancylobacter amanitiformis]MDQ0510260.1 uncharacterized protein YcbK (DUF882 family) [Ancylobacter amanitiformis]
MRIHLALGYRPVLKAALLAAAVMLCSTDLLQDAVANGDTRTISLHHVHSGESATITFKKNGRYDPAALKQLNVLLQDWRRKEPTNMDPRLFDIVWEVYRDTGATDPIQVIGGYRSPETNSMLRARSRGVAQTSLHMQGKAMDFYIPGVSLAKIREAGLRLQRGGVGFYPTSGSPFVHLDTGGIRHWPRMTRTELARVFPDGRTVHIPADGKPMPGYALALADVEARGSEPGGAGAAFAGLSGGNNPKPRKNLFASLFGKEEDDEDSAPAPARNAPAAARPAPAVVATADEIPDTAASDTAAPEADTGASTPTTTARAVPRPTPNPLGRLAMAQAAVAPAPVEPAAVVSAPAQAAAAVPLPPAAPLADRQALAALAAAVPRPPVRSAPPADAAEAIAALPAAAAPLAVVASAGTAAPRPPARPGEINGLPELIVRGTEGGGPALAYASATAGDIFPATHAQPGRAPAPAAGAHATAPPRAAGASYTRDMQADIRRLFNGPTVARTAELRTPELRRFAAFVAPPRQVVAGGFGKDGSNGLSTTHFTGAAVVAVPVVAMISGPAPLARKL